MSFVSSRAQPPKHSDVTLRASLAYITEERRAPVMSTGDLDAPRDAVKQRQRKGEKSILFLRRSHGAPGTAMLLHVKILSGTAYTLDVDPSISISALKAQVASKTGVPAYQQKLGFQNGGYVELQDNDQLSKYKLSSGDTVLLVVKDDAPFEVSLKTDKGRNSPYTIRSSEGVTEFKAKVQEREGVQVSQFWLCYDSRTLEDGRKLGEYNIVPGGTIYMNLRLRGG